ncbi:MAG: FSR family fosmidomycin resistance protein-like MFS transporter [Woeseiaceae bacterium]|jgi:FSR family fosmidomycin resistance protein-like MFS transporter|tara:strand:- start:1815 stop:3005 length:1191 start_codon:yes stop_codon:yes gene_type:complete
MPTTQTKLSTFYAAIGHLFMHMFAAIYFVIVLGIESAWQFSYAELIELWFIGSLLIGLGSIPSGWLSDRWSRSGMIAIMFLGLGVASIFCGLSDTKFLLMINLSILGLFCSIYHPAGISWVVNMTDNTGRALGFNNIFGGVGIGLGALSSGYLVNNYSWQAAFILPGILSVLLGIALTWHIYTNKISLQNKQSIKFSENPQRGDYIKIIIIMLISITCVGFTFQILQTSLPKVIDIRLTDLLSLDPAKIGLVISSIYVISGLMNYVGGIAADRYSVKFIYAYGMLVQGILLFAFAGMDHAFLIVLALVIVAFNSSILPAENILLARFAPAEYQSMVYGIKFILSFSLGPLVVFLVSRSYALTGEFYYLYLTSGVFMSLLFFMILSLPAQKSTAVSA